MDNATLSSALDALGSGLPVLLLQFAATLALLGIGMACYMAITPFHERRLVAEGNVAGGVVLGGAIVGLAVPLAATLATSGALLDILLWGLVALVLQLLAFFVAGLLVKDLKAQIEGGNIASALTLLGVQLGIALLNAAAMVG